MREPVNKGCAPDWFGMGVCFVFGAVLGALLGWNIWVGLCGGNIGRRYPLLYLPDDGLNLSAATGLALTAGFAAICGGALVAWYWLRNRGRPK